MLADLFRVAFPKKVAGKIQSIPRVDKAHIDVLVTAGISHRDPLAWYLKNPRGLNLEQIAGIRHELRPDTADAVGQMLLDENVNSVRHRYPGSGDNLPGRTDREYLTPFVHDIWQTVPSVVQVLKLLDCYEYQSCEHPEWDDSEARAFCQALRSQQIGRLPGYEEARWCWTQLKKGMGTKH